METTIVHWGYIGIYRGNGKENGNPYSTLGLYTGITDKCTPFSKQRLQ